MPACLAHYQFGQDMIGRLDDDMRRLVLAHRNEYEIGLQGPDIFFYYKPYKKNEIANYGTTRHLEKASRMFAPILEKTQQGAALSYLFGLICHYALDRNCHPYVCGHSPKVSDHLIMEAAYDRHIAFRCGLQKARYSYILAFGPDYSAMAALWPGMGRKIIKKCVRALRRYTRLLDCKKLMNFLEAAAGRRGAFSTMSLPDIVPETQLEHICSLDMLYQKALDECPALIRVAVKCMGTNQMPGSEFNLNYEGEDADE